MRREEGEQHEEKAIEALVSLVDELADDSRVHKILCEAVEKLRGRPCRPHWWRLPAVGDDALVCDQCGRRLRFATMGVNSMSSITDGFERRHGKKAGDTFRSAFIKAASGPSPVSQPDTWKGPAIKSKPFVQVHEAVHLKFKPLVQVHEAVHLKSVGEVEPWPMGTIKRIV